MEKAALAKWTIDDIMTLLETMKQSIAERVRDKVWSVGLKTLDWDIVAFEKFTPEQCCTKWNEIMQKLRKIKTLDELIADAQSALGDSNKNMLLVEDSQVFCKNSNTELSSPKYSTFLKTDTIEKSRPKQPPTAHGLYYVENKNKLMKRKPGMSSRDVMKLANDEYKKLPPQDKERFVKEAKKAREQYLISVDKWRRLHQLEPETQQKKNKSNAETKKNKSGNKEKNAPKKRLNGFNLFCKEQKSLLTGLPQKDIPTVWARQWRALSKEQKKKYSERCSMIKKAPFLGEPKIPTHSICGLYCKKKIAELKEKGEYGRKLLPMFARQSKKLSKQERAQYQAEIENNLRIYREQLQTWFKTLTPERQLQYCEQNPSKLKYLQYKLPTSHHRTSDSEDENFEDSSSDEDLSVIEIDDEDEDEDENMFDLF